MKYIETPLIGLFIIVTELFHDERGYFLEVFEQADFQKAGFTSSFVQDNQSFSHKGVLRGLHFQSPHPQGKVIRSISGEIFDVVIDLRKSSKTFGKWFGTTLSKKNNKMLWIPEGFAHGFLTRSNNAMVLYKTTDYYYPQYEHTLKWNDPRIDITWPLFDNEEPIISSKDNSGLSWKQVLDLI